MENQLLTAGQAAHILGLHLKTVRRFIRDGKLPAHKMGGQWRISQRALDAFMSGEDGEVADTPERNESVYDFQAEPEQTVEMAAGDNSISRVAISAVVDVTVAEHEDAERLASSLLAMMNMQDPDLKGAKMRYLYYENERRARFLIWGGAKFVGKFVDVVGELT